MSLSSRRAWIEMYASGDYNTMQKGRSPHGERGLKLLSRQLIQKKNESLSSRRAWIEIPMPYAI